MDVPASDSRRDRASSGLTPSMGRTGTPVLSIPDGNEHSQRNCNAEQNDSREFKTFHAGTLLNPELNKTNNGN